MIMPISDSFIQSIIEQVDSPTVVGVSVAGSYARGQEAKYSDVDFNIFVSQLPEFEQYALKWMDDRLVSLKYVSLESDRAALRNPRRAIWVTPNLIGMKIVLDKDGALADLQKAAQEFDFASLQPAADEFAAETVMRCAEEAHKILNGLMRGRESAVLYATWELVGDMLEAAAVQRGVMIVSENHYFDLIQAAVGRDTKWVSAFRKAWGLDPNASQYQSRGAAALTLYRLTAAMFNDLISDKYRDVINNTLRLIKEAGY